MTVMAASQHKEAAYAFINFILEAANGKWVAENILYKVPNKAAMDGLDPALVAKYPNLGITPAELTKYEQLLDVGVTQKDYARIVSEVQAAK
jgi:spermidine/putrescine transport system substrate-binding protein